MKEHRPCLKCGGTDLIKIPGKVGSYGTGNNILTGVSVFSAVPVHRYVCCTCGYSEEWIDQENLQKLKKKYD